MWGHAAIFAWSRKVAGLQSPAACATRAGGVFDPNFVNDDSSRDQRKRGHEYAHSHPTQLALLMEQHFQPTPVRTWLDGPAVRVALLTALRARPPFSWGVTSGGPPGGRSLSKDGTRANSAKYFCRLVSGVYYAGNLSE